jgi:hypothetical protein
MTANGQLSKLLLGLRSKVAELNSGHVFSPVFRIHVLKTVFGTPHRGSNNDGEK